MRLSLTGAPWRETMMRKYLLMLAALTLVAGCETRVPIRSGVGLAYYDGYYDGYYGPFDDGYWGNDGFFWYRGGDRGWHRDDAHHFRHDGGRGQARRRKYAAQ